MDLTFAHYRNRFCMFRTYYALAVGKVKPDSFNMKVIELPDPPSREQEEALIRGDVQVANLYLPNFLQRKLAGAPIVGLCTEWKSTMKGNGMFVRKDGPVKKPADLQGRTVGSHQGPHAIHRYLLRHQFGVDDSRLAWVSRPQEQLLTALKLGEIDAAVLLDQFFFRGEQDREALSLHRRRGLAIAARFSRNDQTHSRGAEDLLRDHPGIKDKAAASVSRVICLERSASAGRSPTSSSSVTRDKRPLLASARYPRIEFTLTEAEHEARRCRNGHDGGGRLDST
jgi:hypothetical protein